ncbi:hypothetical protein GOP47_0001708 [Adiantum capillus-veneris]|uniref:Uncharacterized protein n=1 Tax=Adiantum capillus-veneris TaxID=13818 RepID=A0A9D4V9J5_ADICA|nr:hypothetical protein GOP47_0001708 [Adiantum capillus-veneris]
MKAMTRPCRLSPRSLLHTTSTCLSKPDPSTSPTKPSAYQQQELDFFKAAEILFSEENPKRRKKFGWDFHLWQAVVACLPSLAVYLTAQYARWDIRRMEAEREREVSEKREIEEKQLEEEAHKLPGFRTVHERLDKLEGKISELESKTGQSAAAKLEKVEKEENNLREGNADTSKERKSEAKAPESVTQNAVIKKEVPKESNEESVKAFEGKVKDKNLQKKASKAV